jgi:hypothetical protein
MSDEEDNTDVTNEASEEQKVESGDNPEDSEAKQEDEEEVN